MDDGMQSLPVFYYLYDSAVLNAGESSGTIDDFSTLLSIMYLLIIKSFEN
jgi:hypothetical protein